MHQRRRAHLRKREGRKMMGRNRKAVQSKRLIQLLSTLVRLNSFSGVSCNILFPFLVVYTFRLRGWISQCCACVAGLLVCTLSKSSWIIYWLLIQYREQALHGLLNSTVRSRSILSVLLRFLRSGLTFSVQFVLYSSIKINTAPKNVEEIKCCSSVAYAYISF